MNFKHEGEDANLISIEQLERLVRLLDRSHVSELELRHEHEGTRLVLRKAKMSESFEQHLEAASSAIPSPALPIVATKHTIVAPLVGIFHPWAKPKGKALVVIGDKVKEGQLVATIESLRVINDVESLFTGRVVEILVEEGQPVEYGQPLMIIDSAAEGEGK